MIKEPFCISYLLWYNLQLKTPSLPTMLLGRLIAFTFIPKKQTYSKFSFRFKALKRILQYPILHLRKEVPKHSEEFSYAHLLCQKQVQEWKFLRCTIYHPTAYLLIHQLNPNRLYMLFLYPMLPPNLLSTATVYGQLCCSQVFFADFLRILIIFAALIQ